MNTKSKVYDKNFDKAVDKLAEKTNKNLNLSNSEESYEEYTEKELYFIDKYRPLSLYRMEDEEIYDIVLKHNFNEEKIENEIKEFVRLINIKGDDYGWNIIDEGKKKKLFINDNKTSNKETENKRDAESYKDNNEYYNNYRGKNYYAPKKNYYSKNYYNTNKNYYYNSNYYNYDNAATEEIVGENEAPAFNQNENKEKVEDIAQEDNYTYKNNYSYPKNNYYSYNSYRGSKSHRGRGFYRGRGRGRYRNNNYSRDDWIFEKEVGKGEEREENNTQAQANDEALLESKEAYLQEEVDRNQVDEDNHDNYSPEENFIEEEIPTNNEDKLYKEEVIEKHQPQKETDNVSKNEEPVVHIETKIVDVPKQENIITKNNKVEVPTQPNKPQNVDIENSASFNINTSNNINLKSQNQKIIPEYVSSNVLNFSFIGNPNSNKSSNNNIISSNSNLNLSITNTGNNNSINNNTKQNQTQNQNQFSNTSPQMNLINNANPVNNKNESNNKFNLLNNQSNQNIGINLNQGATSDFYNAYQMQMSNIFSQNLNNATINQQQAFYPMPLLYYPPNLQGTPTPSDPNLNYSNLFPYMSYPMGYYAPPQQMPIQQQGTVKDASDLQNKNRKLNNPNSFDVNIPNQQNSQNIPYHPYFYMNSQYPFGASNQMGGNNSGMNFMGFNFDSMTGMNQMNMSNTFENYNQKK